MRIKSFFLTITVKIFSKSAKAVGSFFRKLTFLSRFFNFLGKVFFRGGLIPAYKVYYFIKNKVLRVYSPAKSKLFHLLNKTYLTYVFIIILGSTIVLTNISAQELRDESHGENTVVYSIISKEDYEVLTEETVVQNSPTRVLSYLDTTSTSEAVKSVSELDHTEHLVTGITTTTEGGAAIVKPNIIKAVDIADIPNITVASRTGAISHTVASGDNATSIANKYNVSVETIMWENNLGPKTPLRIGDVLSILPTSGVTHKIAYGENIGSIANKYGIDKEKIVDFNNLFDENDIKKGQSLIIPGGKKVSPYSSPTRYVSTSTPRVSSITKLFIPPSSNVSTSGLLWPTSVRRISQYYSWRHKGLDIAGPTGSPLYASDSGTVTLSGWSTGYGYNILIDHGNGYKTRYAHASKLYVGRGDTVVKGQTIADMGSTGWSTGPHIHYEVIVSGVKKNPLSYIK
jgi:LysM repeat protein